MSKSSVFLRMKWKILLAMCLFVMPLGASAAGSATLGVSFSGENVTAGDFFDVSIPFNSNGEGIDTVRAVVTYNPTVLEALSVHLDGPFDRSAPGNYINNGAGKISWGAFTLDGPLSAGGTFARITFFARTDGDGAIAISPDSKMISKGAEKIASSSLGETVVPVLPQPETTKGLSLLVVNSKSHANEQDWYAVNDVSVEWVEIPGESSIAEYFYAFDQSPNTDPSTSLSSSEVSLNFSDVEDGAHYFHIKARQADGQFTETLHRRIRIDTTAPNNIELTESDRQILEGESLYLTFGTTDETSGVLQYQVAVNDADFELQQSPLELSDLDAGTYFLRVAALDRAGNATYRGKSVRVYPEGTDLERPEGYEDVQEVDAIGVVQQQVEEPRNNRVLLITIILVVLGVFGIILARNRRKNLA